MRYDRVVEALDAFATLPIDNRPPRTGQRMRALLDQAGSPDRTLGTIVVAGTCGKGSTAAMIASILQAAGHRTGLFTGPHLERWTERMRIDDRDVDDATFARYVDEALADATIMAADRNPAHRASVVEVLALAALRWFRDNRVEYAVMEAGVGGRRDYTMALDPIVCVLTTIDLDHTHLLGTTVADVAHEKAGIARPGIPLICSARAPDARHAVEDRCREVGAPLRLLERDFHIVRRPHSRDIDFHGSHSTAANLFPALAGPHQADNAAAALAVAETLAIDEDAARQGLSATSLPGRLEYVDGDPPILLDGAHQPAGARALRAALDEFPGLPIILILGVLAEKDRAGIAAALAPAATHVIVTAPPWSDRAGDLSSLQEAVSRTGTPCTPIPAPAEALAHARTLARALPNALICVTGSLYLVGAIRTILNPD